MAKALTETVMNVKGVWGMDITTLRTWLVLMVKTFAMTMSSPMFTVDKKNLFWCIFVIALASLFNPWWLLLLVLRL